MGIEKNLNNILGKINRPGFAEKTPQKVQEDFLARKEALESDLEKITGELGNLRALV